MTNEIIVDNSANTVMEITRDTFEVFIDEQVNTVLIDDSLTMVMEVDSDLNTVMEVSPAQGLKGDPGDPGQDGLGVVLVTVSIPPFSDTVADMLSTLVHRTGWWDVTLVETVTGEYTSFTVRGGHGNSQSFGSGKFGVIGHSSLKSKVNASIVLNGTELELHIINTGSNFLQAKILQLATEDV